MAVSCLSFFAFTKNFFNIKDHYAFVIFLVVLNFILASFPLLIFMKNFKELFKGKIKEQFLLLIASWLLFVASYILGQLESNDVIKALQIIFTLLGMPLYCLLGFILITDICVVVLLAKHKMQKWSSLLFCQLTVCSLFLALTLYLLKLKKFDPQYLIYLPALIVLAYYLNKIKTSELALSFDKGLFRKSSNLIARIFNFPFWANR